MAKKQPTSNVRKINFNEKQLNDVVGLLSMNATVLRREVLSKLLNPGKDINFECGYPETISTQEYKSMYDREGVGTRVVNLLPEESWAVPPEIYEKEESEETEFDKKWKALAKDKNIFHFLQRIDVLSGIGRFGILLIGLDDGKELNLPVEGIDLKTGKKVGNKEHQLMYLRPFDESVVKVKAKEANVSSPRYGLPVLYSIDFEGTGLSTSSQTKDVHWTRVLHIADNREISEVNGVPRMRAVYNRLLDLRKLVASSAEMFWKGGFPGYAFELNPDVADATLNTDSLREEFLDYSQGLQRYMAISGVTAKSLQPQVSDPTGHLKIQIQYISITLGIPHRVFMGTEEAKLASSQDVKTWNKRIAKRQSGYLEPLVLRPFVDRLIAYGILPEVEEYFTSWVDLNAPTDKDKAEIARIKTEAFAKYIMSGVDGLIPPKEFLMIIMGMTEEEAIVIEEAAAKWLESHPPEETPDDVNSRDDNDNSDDGE